jgi:hypothetical protein
MQLTTLQGRLYAELLQSVCTYTGHHKPKLLSLETLAELPLYMLTDDDGFDLIWRIMPNGSDMQFLIMQQDTTIATIQLPYEVAKKYHPFRD